MVGWTDLLCFDEINVGLVLKLVEMSDILDRNSKGSEGRNFSFLPLCCP